ncbi:DNA starvation/stationary phase protection protein [Vibrio parahaemolyticus]
MSLSKLNSIGLDKAKSEKLAEMLNELLSDYQVFYMNTRGYHWNVKGSDFFEMHAKYEEIYTALLTQIDEIAERVLTLGHTPLHSYSQYLLSPIKEHLNATSSKECTEGLLSGFKLIIERERSILELASDAGDEGTSALMSDYIREQEKLIWMLNASLHR